ncbi:transcription factor Tfb4 [Mytilinidion resinicola]|uniref:General transcription and DNA repair factor IIH subunit TFB4 n=1 Tax=Mytilinidion resinicola TaxID=574789 RepID=A0A6A6YI32_9PEZI|nr:transcription factor Tfb4 [Mytilinidion resinicola]KAF2808496.1 transcription factor Tfb4 [Mytilinidion resinicola]
MNAIDGTDRHIKSTDGPPPSLLTIILDTNPFAWAHLSSTLPLSSVVANLLVFINAHLASGNANEVAVIASHNKRTAWLYPTPVSAHNTNGHISAQNGAASHTQNANKYQPFAEVETNLLSNLDDLLKTTTPDDLSTTTTQIAGALSTALSYISKSTIRHSPVDPTLLKSHAILIDDGNLTSQRINLVSRILVFSVSGDLASQYIPVMNAIFAAQRQRIPIDILKLAGDTVLLQQACDATGGIYMAPESPQGLLQYLMMAFLPDATARKSLVLPSAGSVDFRAACFCHRNVVDIGFVCSVCLSIFCSPNLQDSTCLTCSSVLSLSSALTAAPALIPRKKKKRKRAPGDGSTPGGSATPLPGNGTPMHT